MDAFQAHYADIRDPAQQSRIAAQLRDQVSCKDVRARFGV